MYPNIAQMQALLRDKGFDPGPIDGIAGKKTAAALSDFLRSEGFLFEVRAEPDEVTLRGPLVEFPKSDHALPWMGPAFGVLGLHELKDNVALRKFLISDGSTLGDPAKMPWCGDFVHTCIRLGLSDEPFLPPLRGNPYLARNWLYFGDPVHGCVGAVAVFWRGNPDSVFGHVGFYVGEDDKRVFVLGGNQSNMVSVVPISKTRLLGYRWPRTSGIKPGASRFITDPSAATSFDEA